LSENIRSEKKTIFKTAGIISFIALVGYPLGYLRDMLLIKKFGASSQTDAWIIASQIPDIFFKLLLFGALAASFIPIFTEFLMQKKEKEGWDIACTMINLTVLVLGSISVLGVIGASFLIRILSPGFSPATQALATNLTRIVFPVVLIFGVTTFVTAIYHAHLRFVLPAFAGLLGPIVLIFFIVFLSKRMGIFSLAYGTVAGASLFLFVLIAFAYRGSPPYRFRINLKHPAIKKILILMVPLIGADLIGKGAAVIWRIFASFLKEGSITSLTLADRVVSVPVIIFSGAIAAVIFPLLSRQKAQENIPELRDTLFLGIRMTFIIFIPATIGFMAIGKPIIRLLFERGLFSAADTQRTATVLFFSSFGLLAYGVNPILYKTCYALKKNWYLFKYEIIGIFLTVPLLYVFLKIMGLAGVALSAALVRTVLVLYLCRVLSRELGGFGLKSLSTTFYKIIFSALLMGVVCYVLFSILNNALGTATLTSQIIQVGSPILAGAALYFGLLFLFKVREAEKLWQILTRKN